RTEDIINKIKKEIAKYLDELKEAVQNKDFVKVNQLRENGGDILNESMNIENSRNLELNDGTGTGKCAVFVAVYVGAAAYHDVLAWTREYAWTSDDPIMSSSSDFQQKELVKNLIDAVN